MKPVEEVIDVVGEDFASPTKQEEPRYQPEDTFGMSFDVSASQDEPQQTPMQDQAMMLPPQMGKLNQGLYLLLNSNDDKIFR